jgi:hypothetical protein
MRRRYTKKRSNKISTKRLRRHKKTRKFKYGGEPDEKLREEQQRKNIFRRMFNNYIIQIRNRNNIKQGLRDLKKLFQNNQEINTLIPITENGRPVDKETYSNAKRPVEIYDFVSPVIVILDNVSDILPKEDIVKIFNDYYSNGGNFNNLSSRFKVTPFENELNKGRVDNVKMLLDQSNPFHIIEDGLNEEMKKKVTELIPNEQKIISIEEPQNLNININNQDSIINKPIIKLDLSYPLPENNEIGYNRDSAPDFWKGLFKNGEELISLREKFMTIYESDKYTENVMKRFQICDLLEKLFPGYLTKYSLSFGETPKTLVTVNILNCMITLLYGIITYKLYEQGQDYLLLFKGGRAIQLSLNDIPSITKYFSEDADIVIIPNKRENASYDLEKMRNLSGHIAYLIKWFVPSEINVLVSLPSNPKNQNKDITKLVYNDEKIFKALSDIGFGEIKEDIKRYFDNPAYFPFHLDEFNCESLFITPTLDDILSEKLYFYSKYSNMKNKLKNREMINERGYEQITEADCDFYMFKFNRAIKQLVDSVIKRDYINLDISSKDNSKKLLLPEMIEEYKKYPRQEKEVLQKNINDTSRLILSGIISNFDDYSNEEKQRILYELYP